MRYILETLQTVCVPDKAMHPVVAEILSNYTFGRRWNVVCAEEENCITLGDAPSVELTDTAFVCRVTQTGATILGQDYPALMHGLFALLEKLQYDENEDYFYIETCTISDKPQLAFRCVHLCVLPDTKLAFLQKCMRACALARYSHIILEFWGMLKYECMQELSWPFAHSKAEIKKLAWEANALGVEIIPMFNHLGHASGCREINGKHVVLDQNPRYGYLFNSYGWLWNYKRADVRALLSKVRKELMEVCGAGSYFHIGCDEAYAIGEDTEKAAETAEYLNAIAEELRICGRRAILWHDMLLSKSAFPGYVANSKDAPAAHLIHALDKRILIADWQYSRHGETWATSKALRAQGFEVVCCPWDDKKNINEAVETVKENELFGILHTTWHTLHKGFREMIYAGCLAYGIKDKSVETVRRFYCAELARKAMPACGDFAKCGWSEKMTGPGL